MMAEIPKIFWLIVGIAIMITTLYIREDLFFFFYMGIAFVVIAILKIFFRRVGSAKNRGKTRKGVCPRCRYKVGHSNFCSNCGARVR